ncbi:MAG: biopolymer transporter ExbD [Rubrivivax sp.]
MSTMTPLQRRQARKDRNQSSLDMNLVSLIDVFTILIFFLLSSAGVESLLPSNKAVALPLSTAEKLPRETLVLVVSGEEIIVEGRRIAGVAEVLADKGDIVAPLLAELQLLAQRQTVRAENQDLAKAITIVGDKHIPYSLLRKVMATASQAGFVDVAFAVQQKGSA